MSKTENFIFADGVGDIRLHDGVLRMDLMALSAVQRGEDGNPLPVATQQLVMSPRAFMRMVSAMSETLRSMDEKGMLGRSDEPLPEPANEKAEAPKKRKRAAGASPNF